MESLIIQIAIAVLAPVVSAAVTVGVAYLVKYLKAKTGIELDKAQEEKIQSAAGMAINAAEEWASDQFKNKKVKVTSEAKLDYALNSMTAFIPDIVLKDKDQKNYLQAALGANPCLGASGGTA